MVRRIWGDELAARLLKGFAYVLTIELRFRYGVEPSFQILIPMTLTIFLVEDNATIRDNLIATLQEMAGAQVLKVAAGEREARTWLAENNGWALAIVDLFIENGSGLGVLKALQKRSQHQRAVILSNYATPEIRAQCLRLGADRVFDKSTELETLIDYLAALNLAK